MTPTLLIGDCRAQLRTLPATSVHCCITSPPYWGLRDYGTPPQVWGGDAACDHVWGDEILSSQRIRNGAEGGLHEGRTVNKLAENIRTDIKQGAFCQTCGAWRGSLGLEPTPDLYLAHLVEVFAEVHRVLRDDGSLWLNLGDSYAQSGGTGAQGTTGQRATRTHTANGTLRAKNTAGLKPKDLVMIPALAAIALRNWGWYLRNEIVWAKGVSGQAELIQALTGALVKARLNPDTITQVLAHLEPYVGNCMPESVKDRCTRSHEMLYLFTKTAKGFVDMTAIQEQGVFPAGTRAAKGSAARSTTPLVNSRPAEYATYSGTRNRRDVWLVPTRPFKGAHFAVFPPALVEPCLLAGTSGGGCCATCGAPYRRVVETTYRVHEKWFGDKQDARHSRGSQGTSYREPIARTTTGWTPTCRCAQDIAPAPCTVLDPFGGTGTVAAVAELYNRHAISIELNPTYEQLQDLRRKDVRRALRRSLHRPQLGVPEPAHRRQPHERQRAAVPDDVAGPAPGAADPVDPGALGGGVPVGDDPVRS